MENKKICEILFLGISLTIVTFLSIYIFNDVSILTTFPHLVLIMVPQFMLILLLHRLLFSEENQKELLKKSKEKNVIQITMDANDFLIINSREKEEGFFGWIEEGEIVCREFKVNKEEKNDNSN